MAGVDDLNRIGLETEMEGMFAPDDAALVGEEQRGVLVAGMLVEVALVGRFSERGVDAVADGPSPPELPGKEVDAADVGVQIFGHGRLHGRDSICPGGELCFAERLSGRDRMNEELFRRQRELCEDLGDLIENLKPEL